MKQEKKWVIFDLDNCLADDEWRLKFIRWSQTDTDKRYADYHINCGADKPGNLHLLAAYRNPHHGIVFMTARPCMVESHTRAWIENVLLLPREHYTLLMRNDGDRRSSVDVKAEQLRHLLDPNCNYGPKSADDILCAYDDRQDICDMYKANGIVAHCVALHNQCAVTPPMRLNHKPWEVPMTGAAAVLMEGAKTFAERNAVYGSNYKMVAPLMRTLFPQGVPSELVVTDQFHLFELMLVKLSRFAISNLTHQDSVHDLMVYAAMVESIIKEQ
jgi:hypothetical protein